MVKWRSCPASSVDGSSARGSLSFQRHTARHHIPGKEYEREGLNIRLAVPEQREVVIYGRLSAAEGEKRKPGQGEAGFFMGDKVGTIILEVQ